MFTVDKAEAPVLFAALRKAGYRKHTVSVSFADSATLTETYWSDGSRDEHYRISLDTGVVAPINMPAKWPAPPKDVMLPVLPNVPIVTGGTFCGRPARWTIVMHPADRARFFSS